MKFLLLWITLLSSNMLLSAQDWGIGLRGGDPTGITVKKYNDRSAWEVNVGRSHLFYGKGYYKNNFKYWVDEEYDYDDFEYRDFDGAFPVSIQVRYLIHVPLSEIAKENVAGLDLYYGIGGQLRYQTFRYSYRYKVPGTPGWIWRENESVTDIDVGVDGIVGLEYTFPDLPFSMFFDVNVFLEIVDRPLYVWGQGGIGVRFRF